MSYIAFMLCIFAIATAITFWFKYSIETSIFTVIIGITLTNYLLFLTRILVISQILIYILVAASIVLIIIYLIREKPSVTTAFTEIITPSSLAFIIICTIYYILVKDMLSIHNDAARVWARDVKELYFTYTKTWAPMDNHNNIIAMLSFTFLRFTGFSEGGMFASLNMVIWASLLLPMRNIKWDKWPRTLIYCAGAYGLTNLIISHPAYYMDTVMGIMAGGLCAAFCARDIKLKDYVWLFIGIGVLFNIKDELGVAISLLVTVFCILCSTVRAYKSNDAKIKRTTHILNAVLFLGVFFLALGPMLYNFVMQYVDVNIIILCAASLIFAGIVLLIFWNMDKISKNIHRNIKTYLLTIIALTIVIGVTGFKIVYNMLPVERFVKLEYLLSSVFNAQFFDVKFYIIIIMIVSFIAVYKTFILKEEYAWDFVIQGIMILSILVIYEAALTFGYVFTVKKDFDIWMASLTRYMAPLVLVAAIWLFSRVITYDMEYKKRKAWLAAALLLLLLFARAIPPIGHVALHEVDNQRYAFTYQLRPDIKKQSEFLKTYCKDKKVLVVTCPDTGMWIPQTAFDWLVYECIPDVKIDGHHLLKLGTEEEAQKDGPEYRNVNYGLTAQGLKNFISKEGYDFVYVYAKDEYIDTNFADLFETSDINRGLLYAVEEDYLKLHEIYEN